MADSVGPCDQTQAGEQAIRVMLSIRLNDLISARHAFWVHLLLKPEELLGVIMWITCNLSARSSTARGFVNRARERFAVVQPSYLFPRTCP